MKTTLSPFLMWARIASNASRGKWSPVLTRAANIMPRTCASTAITAAAAQRKHGPANTMRSSTTQRAFARTVIFQGIIAPAKNKRSAKNKKRQNSETTYRLQKSKTKEKSKPLSLVNWHPNPNHEWQFSPTLSWANADTQRQMVINFSRNLLLNMFYRGHWRYKKDAAHPQRLNRQRQTACKNKSKTDTSKRLYYHIYSSSN